METGAHVTLPTYFNYSFNLAVGLDNSADLGELYGLALQSSPPRGQLKLCNGMTALCTAGPDVHCVGRRWALIPFADLEPARVRSDCMNTTQKLRLLSGLNAKSVA